MERQRARQEPKKVLVIDNSPQRQQVFKILLQRYKCEILTARDADEGLARLADTSGIVLVLVDMNLPALRAIEFIKQVKEQAVAAPNVPVITLSGKGAEPAVDEVLAFAQGNIWKPYTSSELHAAVGPFLSDAALPMSV